MQLTGRVVTLTLVAAVAAVLATSSTALGSSARAASATTGVVVVNTRLAYGGAGAGTGIVLTSSGDVLTNNHVIKGAGAIRMTVPSTGSTYTAAVVGYSVSKDIALLKLRNAHGLQTAVTGNSAGVEVGDTVTAVGNAGGTGTLTTKSGNVTGLQRGITVDDDGAPVRLTGLIKTNAALEPGDSGGPLLNDGRVIGIDAAASRSFTFQGVSGQGFAIPINLALDIANQIEAGRASANVHIGPTAFLGVALAGPGYGQNVAGAVVGAVAPSSPAGRAGIGANDVITTFAGHKVASATSLKSLILRAAPGRTVRVTWVDQYTGSETAAVRLASGPPQ
jgi:S1-C subfamily serine protease